MPTFLKGVIIGFSIAAPVGPIGLLCIRRSCLKGRLTGFISGLGAAVADAIFGLVAALGVTAITTLLNTHRTAVELGGGIFLLVFGVSVLRDHAIPEPHVKEKNGSLLWAFASALILTITNPMTLFSLLAILAAARVEVSEGVGQASLLVTGIFLGSALWWFILSSLASWMGSRLQRGGLRVLNMICGSILVAIGLWQFVRLFT